MRYFAVTLLLAHGALAQTAPPHIRSVKGEVSVLRGDTILLAEKLRDATLLTGDRIVTGPKAQAEIELDAVHSFQLDPNGEVRLLQLTGGSYQLDLDKGAVTYRRRGPSGIGAEIWTPTVSVKPAERGEYRIAVSPAGESDIGVRTGEAQVISPGRAQWVNGGQRMFVRGSAANPEFEFARWRPFWKRFGFMLGSFFQNFSFGGGVGASGGGGETSAPAQADNSQQSAPASHHVSAAAASETRTAAASTASHETHHSDPPATHSAPAAAPHR